MFAYSVKIPIRNSLHAQALFAVTSHYLVPGDSPKFLGIPITNLLCRTSSGPPVPLCGITFNSEVEIKVESVRQMLKDLNMLEVEVKWCGLSRSGLLIGRYGLIKHECLIVPESEYTGLEACMI